MNGNANKGSGLEELRQPLTVDGATVILHFASACENDGESVNGLDTIREILLAAYHTN